MKTLFVITFALFYINTCAFLRKNTQYYYPQPTYSIYTQQPTTVERQNLALDTNTVSQNLPQGGSQSTGYSRYRETNYAESSNPLYNTQNSNIISTVPAVSTIPVETSTTISTTSTTPSTSSQQNELLALLALSALTQNSNLANTINSQLLQTLLGSTQNTSGNSVSSNTAASSISSNSITTNSQSAYANTSAQSGSNANTDMTNNAFGTNTNSVSGGYSTYNDMYRYGANQRYY